MPGLEPGIHVFGAAIKKDVDGRDKPGHDESLTVLDQPRSLPLVPDQANMIGQQGAAP
jgi:hypothetical protein